AAAHGRDRGSHQLHLQNGAGLRSRRGGGAGRQGARPRQCAYRGCVDPARWRAREPYVHCHDGGGADQRLHPQAGVARISPIDTPSRRLSADVVVIGGGGSGLAAAIEAATLGRSVILLEKASRIGGTTSWWSVGSISVNCSPHQIKAGIKDSPD